MSTQTISKDIVPGEVASFYTSVGYTRIAARISAGAGPLFMGVKSTIPPTGTAGSSRLLGFDTEFVAGPGDLVYIGNAGVLVATGSMVISPLPWPVDKSGNVLVQGVEFVNYDAVFPVAVVPNPTRVYAASVYAEISVGIRITSPGNGLFAFNSSMQNAYVQASAARPVRMIMAPGDQLYVASTVAAVTSDFQVIISPCPWWNNAAMMRGMF